MEIGKGGQIFAQLSLQADNLDTVRALHHTVISLREALDKSRAELKALRSKVQEQVDINVYTKTIEKLALENHILRQKIFTDEVSRCIGHFENNSSISKCLVNTNHHMEDKNKLNDQEKGCTNKSLLEEEEEKEKLVLGVEEISKVSTEKLDKRESSIQSEDCDQSLCSEQSQQDDNDHENKPCGDSENESEELDDIELIFTTEETKELGVLQEDLVPITDSDSWQLDGISAKTQAGEDQLKEIPEDVLEDSEDAGTDKDDKTSGLTKIWTQSVLVETDISKCGVIDEHDVPGRMSRRNTLPAPFTYHPISHREALSGNKGQIFGTTSVTSRNPTVKFTATSVIGQNTRKGSFDYGKPSVRPILVERNSIKRESEAQTDITALPSQWKSESYLAHKVSPNFTTLPSKFALPFQQSQGKYSLKLSDKTQEARRTLLSDINFTSMVPELSRSADHLCQEHSEISCHLTTEGLCRNYPRAFSYMKNSDMISPGYSHPRDKDWSPCNCAQSGFHYSGSQLKSDFYQNTPKYRGSLTTMSGHSSYDVTDQKRRHSWMQQTGILPQKPSWGSMPSSPTHTRRSRSLAFSSSYGTPRSDASLYSMGYWSSIQDSQHGISAASISKLSRNKPKSRVTFQESSLRHSSYPGQSLPDLRSDFEPDSGESTDSLIDEAEECLRRSIDSMLTRTDYGKAGKRRYVHRYMENENIQETMPPQSAQPFLPKCPRDLKLDYYVKIITNDGRIMVGRIRYVGNIANRAEPHVGVELSQHSGNSDGSFQGRRYFNCDPDHAVFVPFKKVVMAWSI